MMSCETFIGRFCRSQPARPRTRIGLIFRRGISSPRHGMTIEQFFDSLYTGAYLLFLLGLLIYVVYVVYTHSKSE